MSELGQMPVCRDRTKKGDIINFRKDWIELCSDRVWLETARQYSYILILNILKLNLLHNENISGFVVLFFFWAWIFAWAHCWKQLFTSVNWLISQNWLQFLFNIFLVKVVAVCLIVKSLCLIELGFFLKIKIYINSKFKVLKPFVSYSVSIYAFMSGTLVAIYFI